LDHVKDYKVSSFIIALCFAALGAVGCKSNGKFHPYSVQHAKMHFEFFGSSRGYEDMFIDSFGVLETHFMHQEIVGQQDVKTVHVMIVKRGPVVTVVDSGLLAESTEKDPRLDSLFKLSSAPGPEAAFADFFKEAHFHKIADTTVLGLNAHIWQAGEEQAYITEWKGMVIGRRAELPVKVEMKLMAVDTTTAVDPKMFIAPTGLPPIPPRPKRQQQ
jgi:hypothetical protein